MSLDYVKKLTADNEQVEAIYDHIEQRLLDRLSVAKIEFIPAQLEYIVDEATILRFNRVGSEGMKSESVEGHSVTYDMSDVLDPYESAINDYLEGLKPDDGRKKGVVYFL